MRLGLAARFLSLPDQRGIDVGALRTWTSMNDLLKSTGVMPPRLQGAGSVATLAPRAGCRLV
jgi:hypothetical protein